MRSNAIAFLILFICFGISLSSAQEIHDSLSLNIPSAQDSLQLEKLTELDSLATDSVFAPLSVIYLKKTIKYKNKKENPAYKILQKVWDNKSINNLENLTHYEYEKYEKTELDISNVDSTFIKLPIFKDSQFIFNEIDSSAHDKTPFLPVYFNESLYSIYKNNATKKTRKDLIASQTIGLSENQVISKIKNNISLDFNIYDNQIYLFEKGFISPLSTDGFTYYDYQLYDSISNGLGKLYLIKFKPKNKQQYAFSGKMSISDKLYGVVEINMETNHALNVNFIKKATIDQYYTLVNDSIYVPEKKIIFYDMSILSNVQDAKGLFVHFSESYKNFDFRNKKSENFYTANYDPYKHGAYNKNQEFWLINRHEELLKSEKSVFTIFNQLNGSWKFEMLKNIGRAVSTGYLKVYKGFEIGNIFNTIGYNQSEGYRISLGGRTYFSENDQSRLQGYLAYGIRDERLKYGVEYRKILDKYSQLTLGLGTKRDLDQLGTNLTNEFGVLNRSFASSNLINRSINNLLSNISQHNFFASIDPIKNITVRIDATNRYIESATPGFSMEYDKGNGIQNNLNDTSLSISILAKPTNIYNTYGLDRKAQNLKISPTFLLRYTKGIEDFLAADFDYSKLEFLYDHPIYLGNLGVTNVLLEAGKTFGIVPLSLLSSLPANQTIRIVNHTFPMMNFYEFVMDTYTNLHLMHHFNGKILNAIPLVKLLKWRSLGFVKMAWGTISDENIAINRSSINYLAPSEEIYYEYGFGVENIGFRGIRPLRVDFNWRGNYLNQKDIENFGITLGLNFAF